MAPASSPSSPDPSPPHPAPFPEPRPPLNLPLRGSGQKGEGLAAGHAGLDADLVGFGTDLLNLRLEHIMEGFDAADDGSRVVQPFRGGNVDIPACQKTAGAFQNQQGGLVAEGIAETLEFFP